MSSKLNNVEFGDRVEYQGIGGGNESTRQSTTTGEVVDIVTEKRAAGDRGVKVNASKDDPRFVIKNDNTQKATPYKSDNILGLAEDN